MISRIKRAYVRHYRDNRQCRAYVEWIGKDGKEGRTEGAWPPGAHMAQLMRRAVKEGKRIEAEVWG